MEVTTPRGLRSGSRAGFVIDWLAGAAGALVVLVAINPEYFSGQRRLLGPHDTQIPYQAALNAAQSWWGSGVSLWNWYDQVDLAYSQLTTGWWTIPAALEGLALAAADAVLRLDGQQVLVVHTILWPTLQVLVATFGMVALLRDLRIRRAVAVPVISLGIGFLTAVSTFYYLTGFIYALTPLLILLTRRVLVEPSPKALLNWLLLSLVMVAQSPLFAVGYAFIPAFFLALSTVAVEITASIRERRLSGSWRTWASAWRPSAWKAALRSPRGILLVLSVGVLGTIVTVIYLPLARSFSSNLYVVDNRLDYGLWNWEWLWQGVRNGADPSIALQASVNGSAATGWSYWGLLWPALAVVGLIVAPKRVFLPFGLAAALIVLLQLNTLGPWTLWQLSVPVRGLVFLTYPGSFLFRGPTLVTLMLPYLVIPLAAAALQVASGYRDSPSRDARQSRHRRWVLAAVAAGLGWSIGQLSSRPNLTSALLAIAGFGAVLLLSSFLSSRTTITTGRLTMGVLAAVVLVVSLIDIVLLRSAWQTPAYFGAMVIPRTVSINGATSGQFVSDFRALQRENSLPVVHSGPLPTVQPESPSLLIPEDPTAQYFTPQTASGLFWGANVLARYGQDQYYQQVHHTLRDFALRNAELGLSPKLVPFKLSDADSPDACPAPTLTAAVVPTPVIDLTLPPNEGSPRGNMRNSELVDISIPMPADLALWRTNIFALENGPQVSVDDMPLEPVQGYPTQANSFDLGNWRDGTLTIAWPRGRAVPDAVRVVIPSNGTPAAQEPRLHRSTFSVTVQSNQSSCLVLFQPFQSGWTASVDGMPAEVHDSSGWLGVMVPSGSHAVAITYTTYGRWTDQVPFVLPWLAFAALLVVMIGVARSTAPDGHSAEDGSRSASPLA